MAFYRTTVAACKLIGRDSGAEHAFDHQSQSLSFVWTMATPDHSKTRLENKSPSQDETINTSFFSTVVSDTYQLPSMDEIGIQSRAQGVVCSIPGAVNFPDFLLIRILSNTNRQFLSNNDAS